MNILKSHFLDKPTNTKKTSSSHKQETISAYISTCRKGDNLAYLNQRLLKNAVLWTMYNFVYDYNVQNTKDVSSNI